MRPVWSSIEASGRNQKSRQKRDKFVGATGFEPMTSPTRTVRATGLRHAPKTERQFTGKACGWQE